MRRPAATGSLAERGRGMPRPYRRRIDTDAGIVGATHASPCCNRIARRKRARDASPLKTPDGYRRRDCRGDACVALLQQDRSPKEGEACLAPTDAGLIQTPDCRGDARVALLQQGRSPKEGEACLAPTDAGLIQTSGL